jgi:hypothetical protein
MKAPKHPGVDPKNADRKYCLHKPPCISSVIRFLLAVSTKSTITIITNTKKLIISACLKTGKNSTVFSSPV